MSGMLSSAAVVLSQNTPLRGCGYMQRHLSGQQSGETCLWSPSCHLWLGSWPWNSLRYTERPGEGQTEEKWAQEVKQSNKKKKKAVEGLPRVRTWKCLGQTWRSFSPTDLTETLLLILSIIHGQSGYQADLGSASSLLSLLSDCPFALSLHGPRPIGWHAARHPVEKAFQVQSELPCLCSQTVFPFIPSLHTLFILVLFYTEGPEWAGKRKHLPRLPTRWHDRWKQLPLAQQKEDKGDNILPAIPHSKCHLELKMTEEMMSPIC